MFALLEPFVGHFEHVPSGTFLLPCLRCRIVPASLLLPLQAIESFAVTVKDIAQMLQGFGTELAETELPDDRRDTEHLLETHTAKYRKLKVRRGSSLISLILGAVHPGKY